MTNQEKFMQYLAEMAAQSIQTADFEDPDDRSAAGAEIFLFNIKKMVETKTFKKIVKNIFPGYNEELFLDGLNHGPAGA